MFANVLIQVGSSNRISGADYALESIHNLKEAIPELERTEKKENINYNTENVLIETLVTA